MPYWLAPVKIEKGVPVVRPFGRHAQGANGRDSGAFPPPCCGAVSAPDGDGEARREEREACEEHGQAPALSSYTLGAAPPR